MEFSKTSKASGFHSLMRYRKELLVGFLAGCVTLTLYFGYYWYRGRIERSAHAAYESCMKFYNGSVGASADEAEQQQTFGSEQEKWEVVQQEFLKAADGHSWSGLHGIFLAYAAEAQSRLNKHESALLTMEQSLNAIPDAILKSWFEIKYALMKLDSEDSEERAAGLAILERHASIQESSVFACAAYHLGNYYWINGDYQAARSFWNMLSGSSAADHASYWYSLAKPRLKLVQE